MSHSVVKVTENKPTDSLLLVVSEDGTVTPDKEEVESYLNSRTGATELQVMHVNKFDDNNIDVTLDTLMYVHSEEIIEEEPQEMDQIARNLMSFRMDHDYTPLTSPKRQSPVPDNQEIDELAQTLSILEGTASEEPPKLTKIIKTQIPKVVKKHIQSHQAKPRARMINTVTVIPSKQQPPKAVSLPKVSKPKIAEQVDSDDLNDEDFEDIDYEDDDNDSDFELDDTRKMKGGRKARSKKQKKLIENTQKLKIKTIATKQVPKVEDTLKTDKTPESKLEVKQPEKKTPQKKEKKMVKPPDDFALFSAPDIIRRVGGKEPTTPTPVTTPESPKTFKPAKIHQDLRSKSADSKPKRASTETKSRSSTEDHHIKRLSIEKPKMKIDKPQATDKEDDPFKADGTVAVQKYDESVGSNSSESVLESPLEPLPSAEDIRAIIQNENTKSFTTSLVIPDSHDSAQVNDHNNQANLDSSGLELDQSILDNINTDLISEDILYQVAQSLVDNPELQNVIDKSIVDGNLMLDSSLQSINQEHTLQHTQMNNMQTSANLLETQSVKGTQIVRSDGRILVLPPIERPTTRSRNKRNENPDVRQVTRPMKPLDEEHVSGNELDSSNEEQSEEDESEDDPNKLWCICNQPHNNRFMICCDTCEEWYHGKCVNVTKAMGQMMEQEGREWICLYCKDPSLKRPSAAARRIRKASRTSTDSSGSQRKASTGAIKEPSKVPGCIVCGKPSRNSSIYCSDGCILKHAQGVEKVVVFERKTGKILSGSNAPSAANLDKWLVDHPGFEVVRSTSKPSAVKKMSQSKLQLIKNSSNDGVSLAIQRKEVNIGVLQHQPKHQVPTDPNRLHKKVRLSPDDLASQELALWREREAKHQLDMIKKSELELLNCNRQYVFKTHKGEQVFEDDRPTDQTVTEVITGLGADSTSTDKEEAKKELSKDRDRKSSSSKHKKDKNRDKDRISSKEKNDSKDRRKEHRSISKDKDRERDRRKRSRSREHSRHSDKRKSRSEDRDRHRRPHKSSRHKKEIHNTTEKLDKKSKEILEQLVDKQIVPPLEDRLWKHVPQEDVVQAANVESDSDHEPTSTVTIPTPPRSNDPDETQIIQTTSDAVDKNGITISSKINLLNLQNSCCFRKERYQPKYQHRLYRTTLS
ncbi:PHD finger motif containing protein [Oryctes borbonicus]|uniref:PHD finger motif containing protein n=1 Tax=Oryctes borbonicus TaxID=1629725 RepID=A0A0T6B7E9_9SCAR|nr:PHD finger motif containing protein [Oryctes borbonicus]